VGVFVLRSEGRRWPAGPSTNTRFGIMEQACLSRATVTRTITKVLPGKIKCDSEAAELIASCVEEFVRMVSTEANEECSRSGKKSSAMMAPEQIAAALKVRIRAPVLAWRKLIPCHRLFRAALQTLGYDAYATQATLEGQRLVDTKPVTEPLASCVSPPVTCLTGCPVLPVPSAAAQEAAQEAHGGGGGGAGGGTGKDVCRRQGEGQRRAVEEVCAGSAQSGQWPGGAAARVKRAINVHNNDTRSSPCHPMGGAVGAGAGRRSTRRSAAAAKKNSQRATSCFFW
jgi:histone H3/H4